jgi:ribonuclease HI
MSGQPVGAAARTGGAVKQERNASSASDHVTIYTDGGCEPNPGVGGWAAILMCKAHYKELSGGDPNTTNNRMELTAAIEALQTLRRPCAVVLYTDSEYLKNGITSWLPAWKRRNWTRKGGELKNMDLWKRLDELDQKHSITWKWVRGHAGDEHNERCDVLANEAILRLRNAQ